MHFPTIVLLPTTRINRSDMQGENNFGRSLLLRIAGFHCFGGSRPTVVKNCRDQAEEWWAPAAALHCTAPVRQPASLVFSCRATNGR